MKKAFLSATALLFSIAAMAQAPATAAQHADKAAAKQAKREAKIKQRGEYNDDRDGNKVAPENHGQTVKAVAQGTTLTGADKGAAVSAVASAGRSSARGERSARAPRSARGDRSHGGGNGHAGGGHQGAGHRGKH